MGVTLGVGLVRARVQARVLRGQARQAQTLADRPRRHWPGQVSSRSTSRAAAPGGGGSACKRGAAHATGLPAARGAGTPATDRDSTQSVLLYTLRGRLPLSLPLRPRPLALALSLSGQHIRIAGACQWATGCASKARGSVLEDSALPLLNLPQELEMSCQCECKALQAPSGGR